MSKVDGVRLPSDGLQVLQLLSAPREGLTEAGLAYRDMLAPTSAPVTSSRTFRRQRRAFSIVSCAATYWRTAARCTTTERRWSDELAGGLLREEELLVLDSLVTSGLISGDPAFRGQLEAWSQRHPSLRPTPPRCRWHDQQVPARDQVLRLAEQRLVERARPRHRERQRFCPATIIALSLEQPDTPGALVLVIPQCVIEPATQRRNLPLQHRAPSSARPRLRRRLLHWADHWHPQ